MSTSIVPSANGTGSPDYESLVKELAGEQFLKIHFRVIQFFNGDCNRAVLLAFILNKLSMRLKDRKDRKLLKRSGYWLRCPVKNIIHDLGMFGNKITRHIIKLRDLGAIEIKHGKGNTQWVKIRLDWMKNIHRDPILRIPQNRESRFAKIGNLDSPKQGILIHEEPSEEPKSRTPSRSTGGTECPVYLPSLKRLCDAYHNKLLEEKKIISSTTSSVQWPKLAVKFIKKLDGGYPHFKKIVKGYIAEFDADDSYMPQAYSMRSLVDNSGRKFGQIVEWLNRKARNKELEGRDPDWIRQYKKWKSNPEEYLHPDQTW